MKVHEILPLEYEEQLAENAWRKALAAGTAGAALLGAPKTIQEPTVSYEQPTDEIVVKGKRLELPEPKEQLRHSQLVNNISRHYRVRREFVEDVVNLAFKHQDPVFPKAEDILAVIGVESSFNPRSVSKLKHDPAVGLMQVRPGVWNIDPKRLESVENQIKYGAEILKHYYNRLEDREAALHAYNIGITRFRRGGRNDRYVNKVDQVKTFVGGF